MLLIWLDEYKQIKKIKRKYLYFLFGWLLYYKEEENEEIRPTIFKKKKEKQYLPPYWVRNGGEHAKGKK